MALPFPSAPGGAGRQPELDDFEVLEWIGRFSGPAVIHRGRGPALQLHRPTLDLNPAPYRATGC